MWKLQWLSVLKIFVNDNPEFLEKETREHDG